MELLKVLSIKEHYNVCVHHIGWKSHSDATAPFEEQLREHQQVSCASWNFWGLSQMLRITEWGRSRAHVNPQLLPLLWCHSPTHLYQWHTRAEKTLQPILEILLFSSWRGRGVGKQGKENVHIKPTQTSFSMPTNPSLKMKSQSAVALAATSLEMAGEKTPFYQGCGCGIVIDASINCCLLKCHGVGFLPHFQLQRTADGRGRNNEDPFLSLRLKNLLLFTAKKSSSRDCHKWHFLDLHWKLPSIIPHGCYSVCHREQTRTSSLSTASRWSVFLWVYSYYKKQRA